MRAGCFIQDCRGRFKSSGTFYKYTGEAQDGYDTVEWLATQSWCNGSIVTDGPSYLSDSDAPLQCVLARRLLRSPLLLTHAAASTAAAALRHAPSDATCRLRWRCSALPTSAR